jgi:hypothetical protein
MKYYDFTKAKNLIEQSKDCIQSASLGMHEDWWWTAETVFENGKFTRSILSNEDAKEMHSEYVNRRKGGMSIFDDDVDKYSACLIGGIMGSDWATPTLNLVYADGEDKMIPCFISDGDDIPLGDKIEKQVLWTSGVLSSKVQENITPLENY